MILTPIPAFMPTASASYVGPGDIQPGAIAWWGLRAYSAATAGGNCMDIIRASDSTTNTFNTLANGNLDVASITTFLTSTTGKITKLYDQTGNAHDLTPLNAGARPAFTFNVIGSRPGITFNGSSSLVSGSNSPAISTPASWSFVGKVTTNNGQAILAGFSSAKLLLGFNSAGDNTWFMYTGNNAPSGTAADNVYHAAQAIFITSTTGNLCIDGTDNTGNPGSQTVAATAEFSVGSLDGFSQFLTGVVLESGQWNADLTSVRSAMNSNQKTYWGY